MKNVGIITFWDSKDNYGQLLQNFALIKFLESLGFHAKLIRVENCVKKGAFYYMKKLLFFLVSPQKLYKKILSEKIKHTTKIENQKHSRGFETFREKNIPATDYIHMSNLFLSPPPYDVFITGSDQVWFSLFPLYYLQFAPPESKKIAYAASMGGFKPAGKKMQTLRKLVKDFDYVSLREKQAYNYFIQNKICAADYVPDPTLLLSKEDYKSLYEEQKFEKPYIFLYLLGNKLQFDVSQIYQYAQKKRLDVVYVASQGRSDSYTKQYPTIEEWLNLIEHAEMIVTNSFHGTCFSMIYRKKFMALLLNGVFAKMNDRITDMLEKYGLSNRIFSESIDDCEKDIDYALFEKITGEEKKYVAQKLKEVIG